MKPRIVVVGLGSIGRRHARLLARRDDLIVEWCEAEPAAIAAAQADLGPPAKIHGSFAQMLGTAPELVLIATPHAAHAAQTIAALEAGAHVFCEKPMADTLASAARMRRAAATSGRVLTFGFQLHFNPGLRRLRELVAAGSLGELVHFHCRVGSYITLVNSRSRHQSRLEGALLMDYTHQPDLLYWFLGDAPNGVFASGGQGGRLELSSRPNFIALNCDYRRSLLATIHLNYVQMPERHEYEIVGDEGWALFDFNTGRLRLGRRASASESVEEFPVERDPMYAAEHTAFLDAVAGRRPPESPPDEAIVSMQIIDAALASWRTRAWVALPPLPLA
ncbi:MAG: Gfo/Idh/MocA family oxidoreductase [Opitutaceae bacterium]|nr:Gfo/Idh/MocA family oxidoreductase [Opitutaceae bacterium]